MFSGPATATSRRLPTAAHAVGGTIPLPLAAPTSGAPAPLPPPRPGGYTDRRPEACGSAAPSATDFAVPASGDRTAPSAPPLDARQLATETRKIIADSRPRYLIAPQNRYEILVARNTVVQPPPRTTAANVVSATLPRHLNPLDSGQGAPGSSRRYACAISEQCATAIMHDMNIGPQQSLQFATDQDIDTFASAWTAGPLGKIRRTLIYVGQPPLAEKRLIRRYRDFSPAMQMMGFVVGANDLSVYADALGHQRAARVFAERDDQHPPLPSPPRGACSVSSVTGITQAALQARIATARDSAQALVDQYAEGELRDDPTFRRKGGKDDIRNGIDHYFDGCMARARALRP